VRDPLTSQMITHRNSLASGFLPTDAYSAVAFGS